MSRRGKRRTARSLLPLLMALVLVVAVAGCAARATPTELPAATSVPATAAPAGTGVPAATSAVGASAAGTPAAGAGTAAQMGTAGPAGTPATPGATRTAAPTPTPVPTLTELQARLALAKAYLDGKDYDTAATSYAQIVEDTRGNNEALEGLKAALAGKAAIQATQMAPIPTEVPPAAATPVPAQTLASATRSKVLDAFGLVVAFLLLVALLYLFGALLRWVLTGLRELWYMRVLPLLRRPAVPPGFVFGEFAGAGPSPADGTARIIPIAITQKLTEWNQLVGDRQVPVDLERERPGGALAWLHVLWAWVLPPPRGYRVTGTLLNGSAGTQQLAVQRTNLGRNSVDRSHVFESDLEAPTAAYRAMAGETAKWLLLPADMEADQALALARGAGGTAPGPSSSAAFDAAIDLLLPVRQQVNQGAVDFPDGRRRLREAQALIAGLPTESALRGELTRLVADLRKSVPGES